MGAAARPAARAGSTSGAAGPGPQRIRFFDRRAMGGTCAAHGGAAGPVGALALACALVTACSSGPAAPSPGNGAVTVAVLPNPLHLSVGGGGTLTATARSSSGSAVSSSFSWSSQAPGVASVNAAASSPGTARAP